MSERVAEFEMGNGLHLRVALNMGYLAADQAIEFQLRPLAFTINQKVQRGFHCDRACPEQLVARRQLHLQ
jgi:hypothetical protein